MSDDSHGIPPATQQQFVGAQTPQLRMALQVLLTWPKRPTTTGGFLRGTGDV